MFQKWIWHLHYLFILNIPKRVKLHVEFYGKHDFPRQMAFWISGSPIFSVNEQHLGCVQANSTLKIPMEPESYGSCGHSMVVSLRGSVVPVWPEQGRIVQADCSPLSSRGDPEQSASRTLGHPSFLLQGRKTQIHFRHTQPCLRGRATFLLTAATLEWITKPIGMAQKGACWPLLAKWRHLLPFVCVCRIHFLDLTKLPWLVFVLGAVHVDLL